MQTYRAPQHFNAMEFQSNTSMPWAAMQCHELPSASLGLGALLGGGPRGAVPDCRGAVQRSHFSRVCAGCLIWFLMTLNLQTQYSMLSKCTCTLLASNWNDALTFIVLEARFCRTADKADWAVSVQWQQGILGTIPVLVAGSHGQIATLCREPPEVCSICGTHKAHESQMSKSSPLEFQCNYTRSSLDLIKWLVMVAPSLEPSDSQNYDLCSEKSMSFGQSLDGAGHTQHRPYPAAWLQAERVSSNSVLCCPSALALRVRSDRNLPRIRIGDLTVDVRFQGYCKIVPYFWACCNLINTLKKGLPRHWPQAKGLGAVDSPAGSCRWARYLSEKRLRMNYQTDIHHVVWPVWPTTNTRLFLFTTIVISCTRMIQRSRPRLTSRMIKIQNGTTLRNRRCDPPCRDLV